MAIEFVLFTKRSLIRALGVCANEWIYVNIANVSSERTTGLESGFRGTLRPRALGSTGPLVKYFGQVHVTLNMTERPVSVYVKKKKLT